MTDITRTSSKANEIAPLTLSRRRVVLVGLGALFSVLLIAYATWQVIDLMAHRYENGTSAVAASAGHIDIHVGSGSLRIVAGSQPDVRLTRHLSFGLRRPTVSERVENGTLVVRASCPPVLSSWCTTRYELVVPSTFSVRAVDDGGGITVVGLSGALNLSSQAGSVRAIGVASTDVRMHSSSGSVSLSLTVEPDRVDASASSGSVHVVVPPGPAAYRVVAHPSSGRTVVKVKTDPAAARVLNLRSSSGGVSVVTSTDGP